MKKFKNNGKALSRNEMKNIFAGNRNNLQNFEDLDAKGGRCDSCSVQSDCASGSGCATDIPYCSPGKKCL